MPSGTKAYGNFSPWLATSTHFFVSLGLPAGLEGANWVSEGLQRAPKRDPKMIQNRSKIPPGGPWHAHRCQGVPPRCLRGSQHAFFMHIYAYLCIFCAYLCIFMHVLFIFMHVFISFMHIYTYCCTCNSFLCIFMHIYAFSGMFMNVYVYLVHICTHLCPLRICVHIHTYLFMRRH